MEVTVKLLCTVCCRDSHTQAREEKKLFIPASGGRRVSLQKGMVKEQPLEISKFHGVTFFVTKALGGTFSAMQPNSVLSNQAWNLPTPRILGYVVLST